MKNKLILVLVLFLFLIGCERVKKEWEDIEWIDSKIVSRGEKVINVSYNTTNHTVVNDTPPIKEECNGDICYYLMENSFVAIGNSTTIVIDVGSNKPIGLVREYTSNRRANAVILTTDKEDKYKGARFFILSNKPHVVYDNGLLSAREVYLKHADTLGVTSQIVNKDRAVLFDSFDVHLYVPFKNYDYFLEQDRNSISVKINDFLYMSNCYAECENSVNAKAKHLVLANNGRCPTNSLEYVFQAEAEFIYGVELCQDILAEGYLENANELKDLGITFVKINDVIGVSG